jgi:hypothetical protein
MKLRKKHHPKMNQKLIDFYTRDSNPQDALDQEVAKEWTKVVSGLNKGREKDLKIRYRREKQEQNILFNALMGIEPIDASRLPEVIQYINEERQSTLEVDTSGIQDDGFWNSGPYGR